MPRSVAAGDVGCVSCVQPSAVSFLQRTGAHGRGTRAMPRHLDPDSRALPKNNTALSPEAHHFAHSLAGTSSSPLFLPGLRRVFAKSSCADQNQLGSRARAHHGRLVSRVVQHRPRFALGAGCPHPLCLACPCLSLLALLRQLKTRFCLRWSHQCRIKVKFVHASAWSLAEFCSSCWQAPCFLAQKSKPRLLTTQKGSLFWSSIGGSSM